MSIEAGRKDRPEGKRGAVREEYVRRLAERQAEHAARRREDMRLGNFRLLVFAAGAVLAGCAWAGWLSAWFLLAPLAAFLWLMARHDRAIRARDRAARAETFYERGLARLDDKWQGGGTPGARFRDERHPYSGDFDLFGDGSLFELLCLARTRGGEARLADMLNAPAAPDEIRLRQEAVAELSPRLDLREEVAALGERAQAGLHPETLAAWGAGPSRLPAPGVLWLLRAVSAFNAGALAAWAAGYGGRFAALGFVVAQILAVSQARRTKAILGGVDKPLRDLTLLSELLARVEREPFESPLLARLRERLRADGVPPSRAIARLDTLSGYLQMQANPFAALLLFHLLLPTQWAFAIEAWRVRSGAALADWLDAVSEFEALSSLAGFAYENPDAPFPEFAGTEGGPVFDAAGLFHPLLPRAHAVPNDVKLDADTRLLLVSGSNMSGKSTLMRTMGVNAALAFAGGPVCAQGLRLSPFVMGASIRTQDSLQGGVSRFYAEILRIRQVVGLAGGEPPLLFFLDEILHGTNSHDRRIGAEAVIRTLIARGGRGLVSTHDLALARIADDPELRARNVHFEDQIEEGEMRFDYHLRPGVVQKSNALALMRAVGLDV